MEFFYRLVIIIHLYHFQLTSILHSYIYNQTYGSFTQADGDSARPLPGQPPDNCYVCAQAAARDTAQAPQIVCQGTGVAIGDHTYHLNDYALVKSGKGPCLIGQVVGIEASSIAREQGACLVRLVLFGRAREVAQGENRLHDEVSLTFLCSFISIDIMFKYSRSFSLHRKILLLKQSSYSGLARSRQQSLCHQRSFTPILTHPH